MLVGGGGEEAEKEGRFGDPALPFVPEAGALVSGPHGPSFYSR